MSPKGYGANRFVPFDLDDLRGLDENENPHLIHTKSLTVANNVWRLGRSLGTRPGMVRDPDNVYDAAIASAPTICGIADFRRSRNASRTLVVVVPGAIHTSDTATVALGASGVVITNAAELPWTFAQHKNKLFAAGGDVGVGATAGYWDGAAANPTRLGILNNAGANIEPRYIFSFANRLWAGGFSGTDPSGNPGIVRYSSLNDGTVWPTENTVGGNNSVGGFAADDEEFVTGIARFQNTEGRWLLVQTNRRLYPLHESLDPRRVLEGTEEVPVGCVGQTAWVDLGVDAGDAVFLSDQGVHSLLESRREGNERRRFLSWQVRKTFKTINRSRAAYVVSAPWQEHGLAIFSLPTGSNTENDTVLVLDLKDVGQSGANADTAMWYKWTLGSPVSYLAPGRDVAGNPQLYWGDYDGNVGVFSTTTYSDLGSAYSVRFRTKFTDFNAAVASKTLGDIYLDIGVPSAESAYTVNFQPVFDFGRSPGESFPIPLTPGGQFTLDVSILDEDSLGESETIFHTKLFAGGRFYTCAFEVSNSSLNRPFYIHRIAGEVAVDGESAQDEAA